MKPGFPTRIVLILCVAGLALPAQAAADEGRYGVPALDAFHDVIYPIWHTAYPRKDLAALRGFVPEVEELAQAVEKAKLPGILREQQDDWDKAILIFRKAVDAYRQAAAGEDGPALLGAAEAMHSAYEMLNRVVRPLPREVMDFHETMYVVYHIHVPAKDQARIREQAAVMQTKAEVLLKLKLSRRFESKQTAFDAAAAGLHEAVLALTAVPPGDDAALHARVETVHSRYKDLQSVFE